MTLCTVAAAHPMWFPNAEKTPGTFSAFHGVCARPILHILKDEPDNRILECAIAAQAEYVVSGDRHLLALKRHADITMISLADFLAGLHK